MVVSPAFEFCMHRSHARYTRIRNNSPIESANALCSVSIRCRYHRYSNLGNLLSGETWNGDKVEKLPRHDAVRIVFATPYRFPYRLGCHPTPLGVLSLRRSPITENPLSHC